jgi:hypothetical protein
MVRDTVRQERGQATFPHEKVACPLFLSPFLELVLFEAAFAQCAERSKWTRRVAVERKSGPRGSVFERRASPGPGCSSSALNYDDAALDGREMR